MTCPEHVFLCAKRLAVQSDRSASCDISSNNTTSVHLAGDATAMATSTLDSLLSEYSRQQEELNDTYNPATANIEYQDL